MSTSTIIRLFGGSYPQILLKSLVFSWSENGELFLTCQTQMEVLV